MKKLLIIGQIPKEYGGSYTTGVANVIVELSKDFTNYYDVHIYATNFQSENVFVKDGISFHGYSKPLLMKLLTKEILTKPFSLFKEIKNYQNEFGLPRAKFMMYRLILSKYIREIKPDIINAHGISFVALEKHLGLKEGFYFSFHGFTMEDPNSIKANKTRNIDIRRLYYNAAKYVKKAIYLTPEMKSIGENILKIVTERDIIISNGVNIEKFGYDLNQRNTIRNNKRIGNQERVILSVGALTHLKNHVGFIEFLMRNHFKGHYWIIGKFEAEETLGHIRKLQGEIKEFTIELIEYVPHDELYKYYSAADIYAQPSTSEGQALVVFEALCSGLPVIVNKMISGTIPLDNTYDTYIRHLNLELDEMPDFERFVRKELSEKCKAEFSWENSCKQYVNYFKELI